MAVNTVALVDQQSKYLRRHTPFKVGAFSGDMNLDFWNEQTWKQEINKYQVLVMTTQIVVNIVTSNFLSKLFLTFNIFQQVYTHTQTNIKYFLGLKNVNLLIFDECHHGVNDHAMRQLMKFFQNVVEDKPRVLGLTASILNKNVKIYKVDEELKALETTFHSNIATVEELEAILGLVSFDYFDYLFTSFLVVILLILKKKLNILM